MTYFSKETIFMKHNRGLYSSDETYNHYNLLTLHITNLCKYLFCIRFFPLSTKIKMVLLYAVGRSQ